MCIGNFFKKVSEETNLDRYSRKEKTLGVIAVVGLLIIFVKGISKLFKKSNHNHNCKGKNPYAYVERCNCLNSNQECHCVRLIELNDPTTEYCGEGCCSN